VKERGILRYNFEENRYGIWDGREDGWYISGLHCGMCFSVWLDGRWVPTRIELATDWFLVGLDPELDMRGLRVFM